MISKVVEPSALSLVVSLFPFSWILSSRNPIFLSFTREKFRIKFYVISDVILVISQLAVVHCSWHTVSLAPEQFSYFTTINGRNHGPGANNYFTTHRTRQKFYCFRLVLVFFYEFPVFLDLLVFCYCSLSGCLDRSRAGLR